MTSGYFYSTASTRWERHGDGLAQPRDHIFTPTLGRHRPARTTLINAAPGGVEGPRRRAGEGVWVLSSRGTTRSRRMPPPRPATVARRQSYPLAPSVSVAPIPLCQATLRERPPGQHGAREKAPRKTYAQFDRAFVALERPVAWSGESRSYPNCQDRPLSGRFRRLGSDVTGIARDAAVTRRCPPPTPLLLKCQ